jgi:ABC-type glycerol-3-phosphate transport system substrate-binding protein
LCIINIYIKLKNKKKMKKVIAIFAIATTMVACGGKGTTTEATTDSTAVVVDSTAVTATDSTTAQIPTEATVETK